MKKTQTKTKKKRGIGKTIAVLALSAIMLAGGCAVGYGAGTRWTYKRGNVQTLVPDGGSEISNEQTPMQLKADKNDGAKFNVRALKAAEYQEYEIDAQSVESAYTATVTLSNHSEATDKSISLTAEFADGQSASEYISFSSATVQSGEQFTISCTQAFGQPITIKATANGVLEGAKPSCSIKADYIRRYQNVYISWGDVFSGRGGEFDAREVDRICFNSSGGNAEISPSPNSAFGCDFLVESKNNGSDMSVGTITEGIKDFKIDCTANGQSQFDLITGYQTMPVENSSGSDYNVLFYTDTTEFVNTVGGNVIDSLISFAGGNYNSVLSNYNSGKTVFVDIQFTGTITGIVYEFYCNMKVNPYYLYKAAQSPAFDGNTSGGIIF